MSLRAVRAFVFTCAFAIPGLAGAGPPSCPNAEWRGRERLWNLEKYSEAIEGDAAWHPFELPPLTGHGPKKNIFAVTIDLGWGKEARGPGELALDVKCARQRKGAGSECPEDGAAKLFVDDKTYELEALGDRKYIISQATAAAMRDAKDVGLELNGIRLSFEKDGLKKLKRIWPCLLDWSRSKTPANNAAPKN